MSTDRMHSATKNETRKRQYQQLCKRIRTTDLVNALNGTRRSYFQTPTHLAIIKLELKSRGII